MAPEDQSQSVSGFSLLNPNRFSMHQSYSMIFASGSAGSTSAGLYLNTLSYKLADPLTLSADVGFYTPLYGTGAFPGAGHSGSRIRATARPSSFRMSGWNTSLRITLAFPSIYSTARTPTMRTGAPSGPFASHSWPPAKRMIAVFPIHPPPSLRRHDRLAPEILPTLLRVVPVRPAGPAARKRSLRYSCPTPAKSRS